MEEEKKQNLMQEDLFADDAFVYYKTIKIPNKNDSSIVTEYKFGMKEITGFEQDRISKGVMKASARTGKMEINQSEANVKFLKACMVEAPFDITEDNIRKLSKKVRDELMEFAQSINEVPEEVEKK